MFKNKYLIVFIMFCLLFLTVSSVSAIEDNSSDELSAEDLDLKSSFDDIAIVENSYNKSNNVLKNTDEDILSDNGKFIDVNDAYVYLNQFRTENGVWQWDENDVSKTYFNTNDTNKLEKLARDLNLEETAKIRAKEIAQSFSHTRPDGTSCFTAFPDGFMIMGENIAWGYTSAHSVTEAWKENKDMYDGQGHRRNMLNPNFNCVGIAAYKLNGNIYWVQNFGYSDNIRQGEIKYPDSNTYTPNKSPAKITAKSTTIKFKKSKKYSITLKSNKNAIKKVKVYLKIGKKTIKTTTNSKGKATFKIKTLKKKGTCKATITFKGNEKYYPATKTVKIKVK